MSMKASKYYWSVGPVDLHAFWHCADDVPRRVWWLVHLGNRREIQLWPLRPRYRVWEQRLRSMADMRRAVADAVRRTA